MIKSETYQGMSGLNYIQDSELAFATIYVVKREGTQHDKYVSGSTNRTYVYNESTGKVSFPTVFTPGDEKVFVLYKTSNGSEPVTPPGVCVPVAITTTTLPDAIVDQPYNHIIYLTGTGPFVVTPTTVPAGMTLTNSDETIFLSGTPTVEQIETLEFSVSNCSGGSTDNFSQSFDVIGVATELYISNISAGGVLINSASGFSYVILTGSFPLAYGTGITGVHGAFTSVITLNITGIIFPQTLSISKNGSLLQSVSITADGNHSFSSQTFLSTDLLEIVLE